MKNLLIHKNRNQRCLKHKLKYNFTKTSHFYLLCVPSATISPSNKMATVINGFAPTLRLRARSSRPNEAWKSKQRSCMPEHYTNSSCSLMIFAGY